MAVSYSRYRTRGKKQDPAISCFERRTFPPAYAYAGTTSRYAYSHFEEIWDNKGRRTDSHAVKHYVTDFVPSKITAWRLNPGLPVGLSYWDIRPFWVPRYVLMTHSNIVSWLDNTDYERGSTRWSDFQHNAFHSFTDQIPVVIDVPNLLYDLFTLKGLAKQLFKLLMKVKDLLSLLGAWRGHFAHLLTLRQLMKNAADGYLIHQFAVKPLIREVESVLGGSATILRRLNFLRKTQGKVFTARYSEVIPLVKGDVDLGIADDIGMGNTHIYLREISGSIRYTATARVKNDLVGLSGMLGRVAALIAGLGGSSIATFLWDKVPFSFVIDWNYDLSDFLERYATVHPFSGELKILSADTSFKKVVTGKLRLEGPQLVDGMLDYGTISMRRYDRQPSFDCSLNLFTPFTDLTPHQLGVLTALVIQRTNG